MTTASIRYQIGGHATFPVRYGWLPKGLGHLLTEGGFSPNTELADDLGLGSKMVESLAFWLKACGLMDADGKDGRGVKSASALANVIAKYDPFFELPATWWFLHLVLVSRPGTVWSWFFNDFGERVFDRQTCADAFTNHLKAKAVRMPSEASAQKDVVCLLSAYAARPGVDFVDPDDVGACPLRDLGLILRHEATGRFERSRNPLSVPAEVFLAASAMLHVITGKASLSLRELAASAFGPGRLLCMGSEAIEAMVGRIGGHSHAGAVVETLAGERHLRVEPYDVPQRMTDMYRRIRTGAS